MWAGLGREAWFIRLPVALLALPGAGAVLGAFAIWNSRRSRWLNLFPYCWSDLETLETGIAWMILAGGMLAGLLLVLRTSGQQLRRRKYARDT